MPVCTELLPETRFFNTRTDTAGRGLAMASNLIGSLVWRDADAPCREALMGFWSLRILLPFSVLLQVAIASAIAQNPAEKVLPDAPAPAEPARADVVTPAVSTETRQLRPSFSTSLTARQKYALAYRRIVSPQMPMKAVFVSGFELAAHMGPDLPTNGWGPFGERVGYNALGISTTTFFNTAFVPALVHQDPRFFPLGGGR